MIASLIKLTYVNILYMTGIVKQKVILKICQGNGKVYMPKTKPNILVFKAQSPVVSDADITSMFLAFVNLIKKNTLLKYEYVYKNKTKYLVDRLNECTLQIDKQNKQLEVLTRLCEQKHTSFDGVSIKKLLEKINAQ